MCVDVGGIYEKEVAWGEDPCDNLIKRGDTLVGWCCMLVCFVVMDGPFSIFCYAVMLRSSCGVLF